MQNENNKVLPFGEDLGGAKRYTLKPGRNQFAPGSAAIHHNNNITDEEAEWYLEKYPHIAPLFDTITEETDPACRMSGDETFKLIGEITSIKSVESPSVIGEISLSESVKSQNKNYENLSSTN